jgi:regulator of sigma E protease
MFEVIVFFVVLSVLVLVHEFGHFIAAKKAGIGVIEFGLGLPPRIWGKKIGETIYSLNWLPIGGFVKLVGEDTDEMDISDTDRKRAFFSKSKKARIAVVLAGVFMNFLLAIVVFAFIYTKLGIPTETRNVYVVGIATGSPAEQSGLTVDDRVIDLVVKDSGQALGEREFTASNDFINATKEANGKTISVLVEKKGGERITLEMTPRSMPPEGEGPLGVAISNVIPQFFPWWQMPFRAAIFGIKEALSWSQLVFMGLVKLFVDLVTTGRLPSDVSGPVGIFQVTSQVARTGYLNLLQLVGVLSVNLAVLNVLPFPALDGGRLLFIVLEAIVGRKVAPKYERWIHSVGMALLIGLIIMITFKDIQRIFTGKLPF